MKLKLDSDSNRDLCKKDVPTVDPLDYNTKIVQECRGMEQ